MEKPQYEVRYTVYVTKRGRKDGEKTGLSRGAANSIKQELLLLKYWPDVKDIFDYEQVAGALKFNFDHVDNKWIRVFVYQDDVRKIMWVFKVISKKTNKLTKTDVMAVEAYVREIEFDIKKYQTEQLAAASQAQLKVLKGGQDE